MVTCVCRTPVAACAAVPVISVPPRVLLTTILVLSAVVIAFAVLPFAIAPCFWLATVPPLDRVLFTWFTCVMLFCADTGDVEVTSWFSREPTSALTADSSMSVLRASSRNLADAIFRDELCGVRVRSARSLPTIHRARSDAVDAANAKRRMKRNPKSSLYNGDFMILGRVSRTLRDARFQFQYAAERLQVHTWMVRSLGRPSFQQPAQFKSSHSR